MYVCMYVGMYVCMYICMYACRHICDTQEHLLLPGALFGVCASSFCSCRHCRRVRHMHLWTQALLQTPCRPVKLEAKAVSRCRMGQLQLPGLHHETRAPPRQRRLYHTLLLILYLQAPKENGREREGPLRAQSNKQQVNFIN